MTPPISHMGNLEKISVLSYKIFFKVKIKVKSELKFNTSSILLLFTWNALSYFHIIFRECICNTLEGSCQISKLCDIYFLQGGGRKVEN